MSLIELMASAYFHLTQNVLQDMLMILFKCTLYRKTKTIFDHFLFCGNSPLIFPPRVASLDLICTYVADVSDLDTIKTFLNLKCCLLRFEWFSFSYSVFSFAQSESELHCMHPISLNFHAHLLGHLICAFPNTNFKCELPLIEILNFIIFSTFNNERNKRIRNQMKFMKWND